MSSRIAKIGKRYFDLGTSNKSFLRVARDLQTLGIKNCYFMLELFDPSLIHINPYSVNKTTGRCNLTEDQVSRILIECARNPWYFLREIVRIPDQGGVAVQYLANRGNIAQAWCMWKGIDSWLCLVRQKGKTTSAIAFILWVYLFGTSNSKFIFINKDGDNSKLNLNRLLSQQRLLPEYMQPRTIVDSDGTKHIKKENATEIRNPVNSNYIITKSKATSYEMALSIARGLDAPIEFFDEPEFTMHIKTIVSNSVSSFEQAAANAKRNRAAYFRCFTCTPGDIDTQMGQQAEEILMNTYKWSEHLYDLSMEQIEALFRAQGEDCNKIVYIEYSYKQIGLTNEWLRDTSAKIGDRITVRRELLLQRIHGSSLSPFPQEDIEYIADSEKTPIDELWLLDYYKFSIYKTLNREMPYLVGVDCSTGTNNDNNAITMVNPYTVEPDAEFECSYIGETMFEELLKEVCRKFPRCVLCIERNSVGDGIIDHLLHSQFASRIYYDRAKDIVEDNYKRNSTVESILKNRAAIKTYYGVYTDQNSRDDMMAILARHVNEYKEKFITHNIIRDLGKLIRTKSGKIVAEPPFHDDSVMSYLIALYVYYHGNNLYVFGIDKGATVEDNPNKGLRHPDEINREYVDERLINAVKEQEEKEKATDAVLNWNDVMKNAMAEAQRRSFQMYKEGQIQDSIYENTPEVVINDLDRDGSIPLSLFDELNGF